VVVRIDQSHTPIVIRLVLQSCLTYADTDGDPRLRVWQHQAGRWAIACTDQGLVVGIVCVAFSPNRQADVLLWLEVLPQHQRQGYGTALLNWAKAQSQTPLLIESVPEAVDFYRRQAA
jgi:GNAT superfamily N-acetyltransferase